MKISKLLKAISLSVVAVLTCMLMVSCGGTEESSAAQPEESKQEDLSKYKTFTVTLYENYAPITCENFENLVKEGFYDGLTFHRVYENFMAQGGAPEGNGNGGSGKNIKGEFSSNGVENTLSHTRGIVSMARATDPDSASSQFFICYTDDDVFLDGNYAAFGEVTEGMETVDDFINVGIVYNDYGELSAPSTPITIVKAEMIDDDSDGHHRAKFYMDYTVK